MLSEFTMLTNFILEFMHKKCEFTQRQDRSASLKKIYSEDYY
jgi:hypothetical protein